MTQDADPRRGGTKDAEGRRSGRLLSAIVIVASIITVLLVLLVVAIARRTPVTVPKVVGQSSEAASATLGQAGLALGAVTVVADANLTDNQIAEQQPAAGAKAQRGSAVAVVLNLQPYLLAVPSFVGLTKDAADTQLRSFPFTPVFLEQYSDQAHLGLVVTQAPAQGETWSTGKPLVLDVSLGEGTDGVSVPDLTGLSSEECRRTLEAKGLKLRDFTVTNSGAAIGTVIRQLPEAGTLVPPGGIVVVFQGG